MAASFIFNHTQAPWQTLVYIVTFRENNESPQREQKFFTRGAAEDFARTVMLVGGVAILTEDTEAGL